MASEGRETAGLIGSDKVEGTAVYGADRAKIGLIERVMIEKVGGKVSYAVLGFGGFLGMNGNDHYPLPWQSLTYNPADIRWRSQTTSFHMHRTIWATLIGIGRIAPKRVR